MKTALVVYQGTSKDSLSERHHELKGFTVEGELNF
jgi:hypothetical protein